MFTADRVPAMGTGRFFGAMDFGIPVKTCLELAVRVYL